MEYLEHYKYLTNVCLNLTDACNLACKYCFVEQHPNYMSYETAKAALDWLMQNFYWKREHGYLTEGSFITVTYFGGEPMLCYDSIIVPLTLYAEEKYPNKVKFSITTNGTLLNEERINFLKEHKIIPLLSIDGAKETQDYNRPCHDGSSSFDKIIKNIPLLLEAFPDITFRSTVDEDTVDQFFLNYLFAEYLGFKNYFATPNTRAEWKQENVDILKEQIKKIYVYRLNQFKNNSFPMGYQLIEDSFENLLKRDIKAYNGYTEKREVYRDVYRCGLGIVSGSIGFNGNIYGCQEQPSKDNKNIFYIGNIFEGGIDENKHLSLLDEYHHYHETVSSNPKLCENCKLKTVCATFACPSTSYDLYKTLTTVSDLHCQWLNWLIDYAAITMKILVKENNEYFKEYLDYFCNFKQYFKNTEEENKDGSKL